ncbi:single-stranded-DNA-specific exonuclease RecJ [Peptostreptococcaceae bacterium pGA-8]|nr:single-stranded-DNA-specific exonuclease RecJ [Peptostreptococcaceae bacterium pGA-8]
MNLEKTVLSILKARGYRDESEIQEFISDKPQKTYDPFLLLNMEEGVDLVLSSIENDERICIYGDYDSDGITSTAIMLEVLSFLTDNLSYYIPSRFDEGYGLNMAAMEKIKAAGVDLIITVDCGSVSVDEVEYAKQLGMKIVVTDHHKVSEKKADCILINPTQPECQYPFKALAGCGVAFKFCQAIAGAAGLPKSAYNSTLDLVAVGTIGDIVPLIDENRTLVKYGLKALNSGKRKQLAALMDGIDLEPGKVKAYNVSFGIVPHLNAAGRIKEAKLGVQLLRETDDENLALKVERLKECNKERRRIQDETYNLCLEILKEKYVEDEFLVLELDDAHEGITGIVAGKIKDSFKKPTIILTPTEDDCYKGTGRSVENINLYELLKENEDLFIRFGGHKAACGFTLKKKNIGELRSNLNSRLAEQASEHKNACDLEGKADICLEIGEITEALADQLDLFEPVGCANPRPLIEIRGNVIRSASIGNHGQYRKFTLGDKGASINCVLFKNTERFDHLSENGNLISVVGYPNVQKWNGRNYLQLVAECVKE